MECHCLRSSELPHSSALYRDFLEQFERVSGFYTHAPSVESVPAFSHEVRLDPAVRRSVVETLREQNQRFGAGADVRASLDRLAAGAVAVVTGQQVGLFSGPAYSFYKALSAAHLARKLSKSSVDAVPVFWMASEDHDLAEVNHAFWLGRGPLERLELGAGKEAAGRSVGQVALGKGVGELVRQAVIALDGPDAEEIGRALQECYAPAESYGTAFGKLMARLLAGRGIILLDPLDARLHRLAAPVYARALKEHAALTGELLARGKALDQKGYHSQVKVTERSTLLFLRVNGQRLPLRVRNGGFVAGTDRLTEAELLAQLEKTPEAFSANALLRSVVQDSLLPTAAYIGGPAEIAYFAQSEVLYRRLLGRMPVILPRSGFTLVEPHVTRLLKKYGLDAKDILRGRLQIRRKMEQQALPAGLVKAFSVGEEAIRGVLKKLRVPLKKLDKTLAGALDTSERKMFYQFLKLRGKAGRSEGLRTGVLEQHERILLEALHPHKGLQERALCLLPFLARHGLGLLDELERRSEAGGQQHQILFL